MFSYALRSVRVDSVAMSRCICQFMFFLVGICKSRWSFNLITNVLVACGVNNWQAQSLENGKKEYTSKCTLTAGFEPTRAMPK